jgi:hypothetical protein
MTNSVFRIVGFGKTFLSPTDFFVKANTNDGGTVEIVLPNSKTLFENLNSQNSPYNYIGFRIVDVGNNASVNNIIVEGFESDKVNGSQTLTINTNGGGGIFTLIGEGEWSYEGNVSSGGGGDVEKKLIGYISQGGTDAPYFDDINGTGDSSPIIDDFGGIFNYLNVGEFTYISNGSFPDSKKVFVSLGSNTLMVGNPNVKLSTEWVDENTIKIYCFSQSSFTTKPLNTPVNNIMYSVPITIIVYP